METEHSAHCPYCGGEIDAGVRKCKHCGEWILPNTVQPTEPSLAASQEAPRPRRRRHYGCIISLLVVLALLVAAAVSVPSKREHREEINEALVDYARTYAQKSMRGSDSFDVLLAQLLMGSDELMEYVIGSYVETDIENYGLFSLGYLRLAGNSERTLVSIAAFDEVFILADYTDIPFDKLKSLKNK